MKYRNRYAVGYVRNCYVVGRDADEGPLFDSEGRAYLDGYAIIPLEMYRDLAPKDTLVQSLWRRLFGIGGS